MRAFIPLLACVLMAACSSQQPNISENAPTAETTESLDCVELIVETISQEEKQYPNTSILDYKLVQNCLWVKYQYSGCQEGEPTLVWDGIATKSARPQVSVNLFVKEAGMCDQLLEGEAYFSMAQMHSVGSQVLVFINDDEKLNFLINSQGQP